MGESEERHQAAEKRKKHSFRQVTSDWLQVEAEPTASNYDKAFALSEVMLIVANVSEQKIRAWCEELGFNADQILAG